ncbi:Uncharacterized protein AC502_2510 [Pseudomonas syringae pv. maculicola]|nr:Uncharacterized protein AC502_2510 [Pseudomonas syringae pv. maculicola]
MSALQWWVTHCAVTASAQGLLESMDCTLTDLALEKLLT